MNRSGDRLKFKNIRLGGTSWVIPGSFAENIKKLSEEVDDAEFVLFHNEYGSNLPTKDEVKELYYLTGELGMTCSVHFTDCVCLSPNPKERIRCEDLALRVAELFGPINPNTWILHLCGRIGGNPYYEGYSEEYFRENTLKSARRIAAAVDFPDRVCAEYLDFDLKYIIEEVKAVGFSICLDIGHLIGHGQDVKQYFSDYLDMTRIFHIHGVKPDGTDHSSMEYFDFELLDWIFAEAEKGPERVMDIEVFEDDYFKSVAALKKFRELRI